MTTASLPDFDSAPESYANAVGRAMAEAMIRFHQTLDIKLPDSAPYEEKLEQYNDAVKAVKDSADIERKFMLRIAMRLARQLDQSHLIPKHRIAHRVCYVDLAEHLDTEGGNRDSFVTPRWLANTLPQEYRKK
jgi:hypothetical protein